MASGTMAAESDNPAAASGMWRWAVSKAEEFKGEMFDPQRAIHNVQPRLSSV